jgi:uncharacterized protein (DUF1684 family)
MRRLVALALCLAGCWSLSAQEAAPAGAQDAAWLQELAAWRAQRAGAVSAEDGWLTLVGLEWLKPGFNSIGTAADNKIQIHAQGPEHLGLLTLSGKAPGAPVLQLLAPSGGFPPELTVDGQPAREGQLTASNAKPPVIAWRGLTLAVLRRGDRFVLRIKDADAPARLSFHGLNWYAPDPRFRVTARWIPFDPPRTEMIPNGMGGTLDLPTPGVAEFTLNGQTLHLAPVIEARDAKTLFFILRDPTSQTTTYRTARFLHTGLPDHGLSQPGTLVLDFNRLENPACAYTTYATCPEPPEVNQLPVALEAGEQLYAR